MRALMVFVLGFAPMTALAIFSKPLPQGIEKWKVGFEGRVNQISEYYGGGAAAVLYRGQVIYEKTYGNRIEGKGKIDRDSLFRMASISKSVMAAMMAQLACQNQISLEDRLVPYFQEARPDLQVKHLLSHTSGYDFLGDAKIESGMSRRLLLQEAFRAKRVAPPGKIYFYSNTFFSLIEDYLSAKLGHSWRVEVQKFLGSLWVDSSPSPFFSVCDVPKREIYAFPHWRSLEGQSLALEKASPYGQTVCSAAGIYLSLRGSIEFLRAIMGNRSDILGPPAREILFKPVIEDSHAKN